MAVFYTQLRVPKEVYYKVNHKGIYGDMQLISDIFGQFDSSERKPFLFRKDEKVGHVEFIIRSDIKPSTIASRYESRVKAVPESFFDRDEAVIKVCLNPIVQKACQKNAQKVPLKSEEDIKKYVENLFVRSGAEVTSLQLGKPISEVGTKNGSRITVSKVEVVGTVKVLDKVLFMESLSKGLGAAKRFGCGLVLIK